MARNRSRKALRRLVYDRLQGRGRGAKIEMLGARRAQLPETRLSRREFLRRSSAVGGPLVLGGPVALARGASSFVQRSRTAEVGFDSVRQQPTTTLGSTLDAGLRLLFDQPGWGTSGRWAVSQGANVRGLGLRSGRDLIRGQSGAARIEAERAGRAGSEQPASPYSATSTSSGSTTYANVLVKGLEVVLPGLGPVRRGTTTVSRLLPVLEVIRS